MHDEKEVCNDPIAAYTTTIEVPYGSPQPRPKCDRPTTDEEGDALQDAKNIFKRIAARYCAKGSCKKPHEQCQANVTISSIENQGVSGRAEGNLIRCILQFKITGAISCSCRSGD